MAPTTAPAACWLRGASDMRASDLLWQIEQTGPRSLPIVSLVCFLVGLIVAYMGAAQLQRFGAQNFIADLVTVGVVREVMIREQVRRVPVVVEVEDLPAVGGDGVLGRIGAADVLDLVTMLMAIM